MKTIRLICACLVGLVVTGFSSQAGAEDIDIYSGNKVAGVPNILFVMDTGANFGANAPGGCTYSAAAGGGSPSLGSTSGGIEQCALVNAIQSLPDSTVNIGLMVFNANNFTNGAAAGVGPCVGSAGGCLVKPLTLMDSTGKTNLLNFIKSWVGSGSNSATQFVVKSASDHTAAAMQEAWAYYNGKIGMSGKDYATPIVSAGCQKNFVIYVGNSFTNSSKPGDSPDDPYGDTHGLGSAYVNATTDQKAKLTDTIKFPATTCGVTSIVAGSAASDWSNNWLDEWARYMYQVDVVPDTKADGSKDKQGQQNITSYTIGVIDNSACKADYPALLTNAARYGGGKYFQTGNADEVKNAILTILNEVQSVNSAFASSSLPVSVNAQGTYLNQIYMGMFRPDPGANPRWLGNLKQYSFIADADGNLTLGDSTKRSALSSAGTGFLSPEAISYWTCSNSANTYLSSKLTAAQSALVASCPLNNDPSGGFWQNFPTLVSSGGGYYDLPDGELVEKGGTAQQIRLKYLDVTAATYTSTTPSVSGGPRKLYTYCPSGSSCVGDLTNSANAFTATNTDIAAGAFGSDQRYKVASITRTGTTAVVTTAGNHGFAIGDTVTIENAADASYNVTQAITATNFTATTFQITGLPDYPTTPSLGAYSVSKVGAGSFTVSSITRTSTGTSPNVNTETATLTTSAAHNFLVGDSVTISGAGDFNGTVTVATIPTTTTITYLQPLNPTTPAVNSYTAARAQGPTIGIQGITAGTNAATVTTQVAHNFKAGQTVTIAGTGSSKTQGSKVIAASPAPTATTFGITFSGNVTAFSGTTATVKANAVSSSATLTRAGQGATATATAAGLTASKFYNGDAVTISTAGTVAGESQYTNGGSPVTITCSDPCTSFTYPVTVTPGLSASGSMTVQKGTSAIVPAGGFTRSGTTVTVADATLAALGLSNGDFVTISPSGAVQTNEAAYAATPGPGWQITCATCGGASASFTYGPVTLTPPTSGAGSQTTAYTPTTPPPKEPIINWLRGQDNFGDETGPGGSVTVRPSLHGDVLHSRPTVLNYGGTTGVIVFYGDNGGVFHAVNGNKLNPSGSTLPPPGNELWGFIPPEMFSKLNRQRVNDPDMLLPSTPAGITPQPLKKDYFIDGPAGVYQLFNTSGTTLRAILYLTMRRGGNLIYALDVTNPATPTVLWVGSPTTLGELGQTWSTPKVARVKGRTDPVVIFAAGYDAAQDTEPPTVKDGSGRGIYILDAVTGALVWSATYGGTSGCTTSGTVTLTSGSASCTDSKMEYSIPSDVALVDKNYDGYIDRLYVGDTGGNVWRVDLQPSTSSPLADTWQVRRLAALGCHSSDCSNPPTGNSPRKIHFPPEVISTSGYDAVFVVTGDREHPLSVSTSTQKNNRIFMLQDQHTGNDVLATPTQSVIRPSAMVDETDCSPIPAGSTRTLPTQCGGTSATWTPYAGQSPGYYITLEPGEKGVNAPLVVAGSVYFGTNLPTAPDAALCTSNLGEARGYRLFPFSGAYGYTTFDGGGLPPSPVAGVVSVEVTTTAADGTTTTTTQNLPFAVGIGGDQKKPNGEDLKDPLCVAGTACDVVDTCTGTDCKSAPGVRKPPINVSTSRTRTYWYQEGK